MRALTKYAPRHASSLRDWKHISNLTLADDDPTGSTPIDLIIGADLYSKVLVNIRNGPIGQPDAIQSHFGWILSGPTSIPNHVIQNTHVVGSTLVSSHVGAQPQGSPLPSSQQRYHAVAHCCSLERQLSHRVAEIQTRLPTGSWHHVNTSENPADCASRGLLGRDLISINLWWHGPSWLHLHSDEWPHQILSEHHETQLELKACEAHQNSTREDWSLAARYSWWPKLIRVTAYIYRFINKCQRKHAADHKDHVRSHAITAFEYMQSRNFWLHMIQAEVFKQELYLLKSNKRLSRNSALISLNPFLDANGLLRVGGRLEHSHLPFQSKHPVLLADHPITTMLIRYTHIASLHAGLQSTLSKIRQEFWIIKSRPLVKSVIYRCVRCTRERAQVANQLMGQLPSTRVSTPTRAFLHSGIDYAGPVLIRASAGRGITSRKAYIAVFICLATRAIHLELVSDYSTPAFLNAFQRFCARRGLPAVMYSDNGTTFTGADKELSRAYRDAQRNTDFLNLIATDRITWSFIPPHAPHFGGLWEAGVKSVKHHLRRIVSSHALTFEEFTTVLCKIEAILNSRPLSPLNDTPDDYEFLTPGHLLIGTAITTNPEPSVLQLNENRLSRWQLLRQITELKTATSEYKRPVTKLCLLPIDINLIDQLSERKTGTAENPTP
ncbi:uncharacterized protein LOC114934145 [Nylanderia fulva]|uniref:uncharacterized protein LOC114934145 n=1 Tax=Nylanderia fulva TaxID=613905 RepID=UPI0010FB5ED9|nr:uncharacterized protein LOC114934145 [Nylanderia fulva]